MTPLAGWMAEATVLVEALTPPDRTNYPFREGDGKRKNLGQRSFHWEPPLRGPAILQNATSTHAEWEVDLVLLLKATGRSTPALAASVANDVNLVTRAFERAIQGGTWTTTGLWGVLMDDEVAAETLESGDVLLTFTFRVETQETD